MACALATMDFFSWKNSFEHSASPTDSETQVTKTHMLFRTENNK